MKSFKEYLEEVWIAPSNGAKYGQVIFLVGGAAAGKSTAVKKFIDASSYKVLNPDDTKELIAKAAERGSPAFKELQGVDPNTPEGSQELHKFIRKTKISSKRSRLVTANSGKSVLPNIIYDRTFSFAGEFKKISQSLIRAGYKAENIHVVFVFTDVNIALERNRTRTRTLPDEVIIQSARGAKERFTELFFGRTKGAVANGEYHIIINRGSDAIKVKDAGKRIDRESEIAKKVGKLLMVS